MSKPNFQITDKETGKTYWISRSVVVIPMVFKIEDNIIYTVVEQRGKAVSHTGKWCCPCGYLDWDETFEEACSREVQEETGLIIQPNDFNFIGYNSKPDKSDRENVSLRFLSFVPPNTKLDMSKIKTKDEIDNLIWLKVADFKQLLNENFVQIDYKSLNNNITWAFNHKNLIIDMLTEHFMKQNIKVIS